MQSDRRPIKHYKYRTKSLGVAKSFDLEIVSIKETGRVVKIIQSDKSIVTIKKARKSQYLSNRLYLTVKR